MAYPPPTPGVYVREIPTLPPSVAAVSTAIPAFIGYTGKANPKDPGKADLLCAPQRIETLMDYELLFGGPPDAISEVTVPATEPVTAAAIGLKATLPLLYYSLRLYFDNGGGPCYVVSAGLYGAAMVLDDFKNALESLKKVDEPTLIVMPDATQLPEPAPEQGKPQKNDVYKNACSAALDHCGTMKDRFAILDLKQTQNADGDGGFRELSSNYLSYGAAYTPYLRSAIAFAYAEERLPIKGQPIAGLPYARLFGGLKVSWAGSVGKALKVKLPLGVGADAGKVTFGWDVTAPAAPVLTINLDKEGSAPADIVAAWTTWSTDAANKDKVAGISLTPASAAAVAKVDQPVDLYPPTLAELKNANTSRYNEIKAALATKWATLPPSGAIAGIYARVDRERGVWKAPANVAVASVMELDRTFTDDQQGGYNVDPVGGRSVNVIRTFTGRGTLVWGARTLAGNDNEWRYVPVRRLFLMIEESAQKSSAFAVFEPNDATTWLKVKAMIESFLYGLWEQGALAGSKPEAAYFVNVGLGTTMTPQDILEGRMNVEIGIAAVRPAEFIILKFSHKMQQA